MLNARSITFAVITILGLCAGAEAGGRDDLDEKTVTDAYVYLLGRALVIRQEQVDMREAGVDYNIIKYNALGSAEFVNPNLDVAYLEAWIAVDDETAVVLEVPRVVGRYYTAQICDEWGEVITNINERTYPRQPYGKYAFVSPRSRAEIPGDAVPITLHSLKAKLLARVELKSDREGALRLQRQFKLTALGKPKIASPVPLPAFDNKTLIGVAVFDHTEAILSSALDVSPVAARMQARVRWVARLAADPDKRAELDAVIRDKVVPRFLRHAVTQAGSYKDNWLGTLVIGNYGNDYWTRTAANLVGIWANARDEVIYYVATRDAEGELLDGSKEYVLHFPADDRPENVVRAYWSVILVDVPDYRVVPNGLNRFNFNSESPLQREADGSLRILISPSPDPSLPESNWLPTAAGKPFSLTFRTYVPREMVKDGKWFPPPIRRVK